MGKVNQLSLHREVFIRRGHRSTCFPIQPLIIWSAHELRGALPLNSVILLSGQSSRSKLKPTLPSPGTACVGPSDKEPNRESSDRALQAPGLTSTWWCPAGWKSTTSEFVFNPQLEKSPARFPQDHRMCHGGNLHLFIVSCWNKMPSLERERERGVEEESQFSGPWFWLGTVQSWQVEGKWTGAGSGCRSPHFRDVWLLSHKAKQVYHQGCVPGRTYKDLIWIKGAWEQPTTHQAPVHTVVAGKQRNGQFLKVNNSSIYRYGGSWRLGCRLFPHCPCLREAVFWWHLHLNLTKCKSCDCYQNIILTISSGLGTKLKDKQGVGSNGFQILFYFKLGIQLCWLITKCIHLWYTGSILPKVDTCNHQCNQNSWYSQ